MEDFSSMFDKEFYLVTLVSNVSSGGFGGDKRWIVDSGASCHMTGIWRAFLIIIKIVPYQLVDIKRGMEQDVCGVGRVIFQLEYGGLLEVDGVIFVPGLRFNFLLVLTFEDVGYCTLFKRRYVFIYREGVDPVEPKLIGDQVDKLYMLRGQPSGYDSASNEEKEAPETAVGPKIQYFIPREEMESLLSTDKRLSWCDRTDAQGGVDSPRSSGFRVAFRRRSSGSSSVQVLRLALGSEGAPTVNIVMTLYDGDESKYIPH
jgi:hypothetical protein